MRGGRRAAAHRRGHHRARARRRDAASPTGRSPRRASSSGASTCSSATRSTRRSTPPAASRASGRGSVEVRPIMEFDLSRPALRRRRAGSSARSTGGRVAILARVLGDIDRAEDALQDAFAIALERWPRDGHARTARAPGSSRRRATGRSTACAASARGGHRRRRGRATSRRRSIEQIPDGPGRGADPRRTARADLRLLPPGARPVDAQVPLTLRLVAGLTVPEVARALLAARRDGRPAAGAGQAQDPRRRDPDARSRRPSG